MNRGSTDEAVVGVKSVADEDAVTYLRVKLPESDRRLEPKGGTCDMETESQNSSCYESSHRSFLLREDVYILLHNKGNAGR